MKIFLPIVLCFALVGCRSAAYQVHPGAGGYVSGAPSALQLVDSQAYDTLVAADAVINQTRADFLANKFPTSSMPNIKTAFNAVVHGYDTANSAWTAFDAAVKAGGSPAQDVLAAALAGLNTNLTSLTAAKAAQ